MLAHLKRLLGKARETVTGTPEYVRVYESLRRTLPEPAPAEYDLVFVLPPEEYHGWILDAICREIDTWCSARTAFVPYREKNIPPATAYYYSHYGYLRETALENPDVLQRRNVLFYTHPRELWYSFEELLYLMNTSAVVASMSSVFARELISKGVRPEIVDVALVGADPQMFLPHERGGGKVGFCSGYLPRKGGERILDLVRCMPDQEFVLCGKKWRTWDRFNELASLQNLEYIEIPYADYPRFYDMIDVFVSVSELEGGPVPLIESAMANAVPVCSRTGHAMDIITHGENGFLFDPSAPVSEIRSLIEAAQKLTCDVRATVEHLSWKRFSHQIQQLAGIDVADTGSAVDHSEAA